MRITLRKRKRRTRESLYLDYYDRGKRRIENLNLYLTGNRKQDKLTWQLAEDIAAKRRLEFVQGEHDFPAPTKQKQDFITYCRDQAKRKRSPNTRLVWGNAIRHLERFTGGPVSFDRLTESFMSAFRDYLLKELKKSNSALVYLARIKTALHQAVRDRILVRNPAQNVTIKKQKTGRIFLTLDELNQLQETECTNQAIKDGFLFSAFSGLRYSDVRALTWDKVRKAGPNYSIEFTQAKTEEPEYMPLSRQAAQIVKRQKGSEYSVNVTGDINPNAVFKLPAQQTIDKAIKRWVKRSGMVKRVSFHTARHSFATLGLTHGVDIYTMSKLLGHRDLSTTEIYAKIVDEKKREAVAMLPTLNAKKGGKHGKR